MTVQPGLFRTWLEPKLLVFSSTDSFRILTVVPQPSRTPFPSYTLLHMSGDARKRVFGVSDQVRHKPACTVSVSFVFAQAKIRFSQDAAHILRSKDNIKIVHASGQATAIYMYASICKLGFIYIVSLNIWIKFNLPQNSRKLYAFMIKSLFLR